MNKKSNIDIKILTTTSLLISIAIVLSIAMFAVPGLQILMFVVSLPIIIIGVKFDVKMQILATLIITIIAFMFDIVFAVSIFTSAGLLGIIQGYFIKKNHKASEIILFGSVAYFFGIIIYFYSLNFILNINIITDLKNMFDIAFDEWNLLYSSTELLSEADQIILKSMMYDMKNSLMLLIPSIVIMVSVVTSIFNYILANSVLRKLGLSFKQSKFKEFRINKQGKIILLSVLFVIIIMAVMDGVNQKIYMINFFVLFVMLMQLNGFSLIWYFSEFKKKKTFIRISTVLMFIIAPIFGGVLGTIIRFSIGLFGFVDISFDFRKEHKKKIL